MPTSTVENYLKQILVVSLETNCPEVPMGKVAQGLCVTSGTATTMIKNLAGNGWLNYYPPQRGAINPQGKEISNEYVAPSSVTGNFFG